MNHALNKRLMRSCVRLWNKHKDKRTGRPLPRLVLLHTSGQNSGVLVSEDGHTIAVRQEEKGIRLLSNLLQSAGPLGLRPIRFEEVKIRFEEVKTGASVIEECWIRTGDDERFRQEFEEFFRRYLDQLHMLEALKPFGSHADSEYSDEELHLRLRSLARHLGKGIKVSLHEGERRYGNLRTPGGTMLCWFGVEHGNMSFTLMNPGTFSARLLYNAALAMEMNHE